MNSLGDNFLFGLFLGLCLGMAVFPLGLLIREVLLAIKSLRPLPLSTAGSLNGLLAPPGLTGTGLRGWKLSAAWGVRPNVRKVPDRPLRPGDSGLTGILKVAQPDGIRVLLFRPRPPQS